ncbi:Sensor histidine kinase RcsC [Methylobacterium crusticola]|uniref:histidine kinase n=1 Tax=Methylobacterium crusticola TaxID=1697972 RepID=A0ABQ4QUE5_9HYPH|nr:PAS domain-containing protein [Methylobacterium crusticola]GJD48957.1 Sensor histidine kinase RcsC [Methylobacterium crusticola]
MAPAGNRPAAGGTGDLARAVAAVRARSGPFHTALERTRQPMVVTDPRLPDNPIVFANRAFLALTGYEAGAVIGRNCRFLQGPETDPATAAQLRAAIGEGREIAATILNYRRDGTRFWNQLFVCPVFDEAGQLINFFASQIDATIGRNADDAKVHLASVERRLTEAQRQLRLTVSSAGIAGTWDWDIPADRLHVDGRFAALHGIGTSPDDAGVPTRAFFAGIHPLDRTRIRVAVAGILGGAEVFDKEYRLRTPDGAVRWVHGRGRCIYDADERPARFAGVLVEITEQKRVEERLRIAQTAGGIGTFEHVPGFATVAVSPQFCSLLGVMAAGTLAVGSVNALVVPGDSPLLDHGLGATGELPYTEMRIRRADSGEIRWLARRGEAIRDNDTADLRHVGVIYDVSAAKQSEFALRELNDTLEQRVRDAIAEREQAEAQLRQSQKMEAVGQLTGGIAHDFNNLLTGIVGSLDLMQTRIAEGRIDTLGRYAGLAMASAQRAAALTHRLLAFSRRQPLEAQPVDVNQLVGSIDDLLRRTLGERVRLDVAVAGGLWLTLCDPNQLENAILNLAINARDAMPDGGTLTIATTNADLGHAGLARDVGVGTGQYVAIAVSDTGTGMPPDVIARAFDPFFTTKPIGQGTGLGLSMIYGFAKQSEGSVEIESALGRGTTVTLYLPRYRGDAALAQPVRGEAPRAESGETVLVVEDDATVRSLVVEVLHELGYRALEAADGPEGLRVLRSEGRIDLLVTDVGLPGMNGRQLADQAREVRPGLKVLFMTGYAENAAFGNAHLGTGLQMITKPFPVEGLATKIRAIIES